MQPIELLQWVYYSDNADKIMKEHPIQDEKVKAQDFNAWAQESLEIAISTVYDGFVPNEKPTQEYMDRAFEVLETRMHYGGKRLADLMTDIYGDTDSIALFLQD